MFNVDDCSVSLIPYKDVNFYIVNEQVFR